MIQTTRNKANDVIKPSLVSSHGPPYSSSSIFWKFVKYIYKTPAFINANLKRQRHWLTIHSWFQDWQCLHHSIVCWFKGTDTLHDEHESHYWHFILMTLAVIIGTLMTTATHISWEEWACFIVNIFFNNV